MKVTKIVKLLIAENTSKIVQNLLQYTVSQSVSVTLRQ